MNERQQLAQIINSNNFVILDTETTGLDGFAEIVSIAIIDSSGQTLLDTLVKPVLPIPEAATRIHGITNEMVKDALPFPSERISQLLCNQNVIIYNASYDVQMLRQSTKRAGLPMVAWYEIADFWCAMEVFAEIYGDWNDYHQSYRWQKLSTACSYYNIPVVGAHGALADCLMTLAVCRKMAEGL